MNRISHLVFGIFFISAGLLTGCATSPATTTESDDTDLLYDGQAEVLYDAQQKAETSAQAMKYGERALQIGDTDRALYQFVTAYELDPSRYMALHKVGLIQARKGNLDRAALALGMALEIEPDHGETLVELGLVQLRMRRHEGARQYIDKALELGTESWRAYNGLAVLADLDKNFETSEQYYEKALALKPDSAPLWNNRGYSRYLAGDWKEARIAIMKALDIDSSYRKAWLNLGLVHVRDGSYDKAVSAFERVMSKANAYERVGSIAMTEGKYDTAEYFLLQAIDESPAYHEKAYKKVNSLKALRRQGGEHGSTLSQKEDRWRIIRESGYPRSQNNLRDMSPDRDATPDS